MPQGEFEEKYLDVLQNIEFGIVSVYRQHPEMLDWDALKAIETLIHEYHAEHLKRIRKSIELWNRRSGRQGYLDFISEYVK